MFEVMAELEGMAGSLAARRLTDADRTVILAALVSFDERVQERFSDVFSSSHGISPWGDRVGDLGGALMSALKHQSIENGPLLVFAAGGAVLFVFMVRT
jgi:hypothetical protein